MQQLKVKTIAEGLSYSRTQKLGEGAFGQVFLGFDDGRKVPCAFKIVNLQKMTLDNNASSLMKKIKDQIVNMQLARHPSIIQFYQAKQSPNNIYILCQYCNGQSLASYIQKRQYLTQWQALQFFRVLPKKIQQILQGFYHLRKNNIVHRDLKPANLLLHNYSIKIGDLGFSKVTEHHEQMLQSIVGTPLYMSPQIFEREKYTEKTDIWSLGVILFEMLYGKNPWAGSKNLFELRERIKKQVKFPEFPIVSKSLKMTIRRMLVVPQNDRISWQALFQKYLNPLPSLHRDPPVNSYNISLSTCQYFRDSFYLQSHLRLPKIVRQLNLVTQEQLTMLLGSYSSSQQFYKQLLFLTQNKTLIVEYYTYFLQKRNEISFIMLFLEKLTELIQKSDHQLTLYSYCTIMLSYRYVLSILEEIVHGNQQLVLPHNKYLQVSQKLCYDKLLLYLFNSDRKIILKEYNNFMPHFNDLLIRIQSHPLSTMIQKELSGIYSNEQNEKKVIRFFLGNYLKKIYNTIKTKLQIPNESMVDEGEEEGNMKEEEEEGEGVPGIELTVGRMIMEYLNNRHLFAVTKEKGMKNMIQLLYDWETTVKEHHYVQLKESQPMKEDSINTFLKKQFLWSKISLSPISSPL